MVNYFVGLIFIENGVDEVTKEYIRRELVKKGYKIVAEMFSVKPDLDTISNILEFFNNSNILIISTEKELHLLKKILSIIFSNFSVIEESRFSYLYSIGSKDINLIVTDMSGDSVIEVLLKQIEYQNIFCFFKYESEAKEFVNEIRELPEVSISTILPNLINLNFRDGYFTIDFKLYRKNFNFSVVERESLIKAVIEYLTVKGKKITFAESCTGGALANRFISYSGASNIIDGSFVTYSNDMKCSWLGVDKKTIESFGAVSEETVLEMAKGARKKTDADIAIAISGIAGPTGAVEGKPVGTVYICISTKTKDVIRRLSLKGDREYVQQRSVDWVIYYLIESFDNFFDFLTKNS